VSALKTAQEELLTTKAELQSAKVATESTQSKLAAMTLESGNLSTELQAAKAEALAVKAKLQTAQDGLSKVGTTILVVNPKLDLIQKYLAAQSSSTLSQQAAKDGKTDEQKRLDALVLSIFKTFDASIEIIRDPELSRAWGEAWPSGARQQSETAQRMAVSYTGMSKFLDRLATLIKTDSDALQAVTAK
jgi:chromosome segregation ATPase